MNKPENGEEHEEVCVGARAGRVGGIVHVVHVVVEDHVGEVSDHGQPVTWERGDKRINDERLLFLVLYVIMHVVLSSTCQFLF